MAKIVEEKITVVLSRLVSSFDLGPALGPVLDDEKIETLKTAVEGLVDDETVFVEVVTE